MQNLRSLQTKFAEVLLQAEDTTVGQYHNPTYGKLVENGLTSSQRLQIYRNNIFTNLTEALAAVFPTVYKLVGVDFFQYMAHQYIPEHPSIAGDIHQYGQSLPEFIADFQPTDSLSYLADVARFDWACHEVFHAAGIETIQKDQANQQDNNTYKKIAELENINPGEYDRLAFCLHPASRLLSSQYPILSIWEFNHKQQDESAILDIDTGGQSILIHRPELDIEFSRLSEQEYALASAIQSTYDFASACEKTLEAYPDANLGQSLSSLISRQVITHFTH